MYIYKIDKTGIIKTRTTSKTVSCAEKTFHIIYLKTKKKPAIKALGGGGRERRENGVEEKSISPGAWLKPDGTEELRKL